MSVTKTANNKHSLTAHYFEQKLITWVHNAYKHMGKTFNWDSIPELVPGTYTFDSLACSIASALKAFNEVGASVPELAIASHQGWIENYVFWRDSQPWSKKSSVYIKPIVKFENERNTLCCKLAFADLPDDEKEKHTVIAQFVVDSLTEEAEVAEAAVESAVEEVEGAQIEVDESWIDIMSEEMDKPYFATILEKVAAERQRHMVYPKDEDIYNAMRYTPLQSIRVVILGMDPYINPEQAHGLSFSVQRGIDVPPSLKNIFKEISTDLALPVPSHGWLVPWAERGVFLLNSYLTVRAKVSGSHASFGWQKFTDVLIRAVSNQTEHTVFMLWGNDARAKKTLIDSGRHLILEAAHPSPLSASKGFFGCRHFSKANEYLRKHGREPMDWSLPA